jgi:hypothetical protein
MFRVWQQALCYLDNVSFGWKTTFLELYNRTTKVNKVNISKTGSKITIGSEDDEGVKNLSFQINDEIEQSKNATALNVLFEKETGIVTIKYMLPKSKITLYTKG